MFSFSARLALGLGVTLTVRLTATVDGDAFVFLYDKADGFPTRPLEAARRAVVPLNGGVAEARFEDVPPGAWAVSAFLDADRNGTLNTNWIGIPSEPVGSSSTVGGRPTFEKARFAVGAEPLTLAVPMKTIF